MDFYFILCGALAILCAFNVCENILKTNDINRFFATLFLISSCVLSMCGYFKIFDVEISYVMALNLLVYVYYFLTLKHIKNYLFAGLTSLIIIAILMCYFAFNFDISYIFTDPIIFVSIPIGIVCNFICSNFKTFFIGSLLGIICFEVIYFEVSTFGTTLEIGALNLMEFLLVSLVSYSVCFFVKQSVKRLKHNKKQQYN